MFPMRLPASIRLASGYALLALVSSAVVYLYLQYAFRDDLHADTHQRLLSVTQLVQAYLEALPERDMISERLDPVADRLGEQCNARVTIVAADGRVIGDSSVPLPDVPGMENHAGRPEIQAALHGAIGESVRHSATLDADMHYLAMPFHHDGRMAGVVRLALPLNELAWTADHARRGALLTLFTGLIASIGLALFAGRRMSRSIGRMAAWTRQLVRGDADAMTDSAQAPEWQELIATLNDMDMRFRDQVNGLTQEKARLEAVLSAMAEGVMVTNADGRIIHVNPAFIRMMRVDTPYLNSRPIEMIRNADLQAAVDAMLNTGAHEAAPGANLTFSYDDRTFQVYLTVARSQKTYHGLVAVFHDVTELRRLEQVRRDFVANVSHELRTPLTSIKGYTETLLDGALEDTGFTRKFVAAIQNQSVRLQALVEDLLQLSRIESGRLEVHFRPCALDDMARRVAASFEDRIQHKRLEVVFEIQTAVPVAADEELVELVLFNLMDNAIKYTPEGGTITLRVFRDGSEVVLAVDDTGVGIPFEALPRIFERFYRVDRARSREQGGTGLGLSIVRHTMGLLHGRVWVESTLGSGSTFYIALPVWREDMETAR